MDTFFLFISFLILFVLIPLLLYSSKDIRKYNRLIKNKNTLTERATKFKLYRNPNANEIYFSIFGMKFFQNSACLMALSDFSDLKRGDCLTTISYYKNTVDVTKLFNSNNDLEDYLMKLEAWKNKRGESSGLGEKPVAPYDYSVETFVIL